MLLGLITCKLRSSGEIMSFYNDLLYDCRMQVHTVMGTVIGPESEAINTTKASTCTKL
jgi:hypothetical protein